MPLFLPVFHPVLSPSLLDLWSDRFKVEGCIVNAFLLYKERELRMAFQDGLRLHSYIGFPGMVMTDSGAFQGFKGKLYLKNKDIVRFQDSIGADVLSPLDIITPPGDNRTLVERKWRQTLKRVTEAVTLAENAIVAGPQQGGKFLDLRRKSTEDLLRLGVRYLALGSLVPFFNKNHDLEFVGRVIRDARAMCDIPIHVFGAGDPLEIPFLAAMGADIFDSSSYAHYAGEGWYMTPYGSLSKTVLDFVCPCPFCEEAGGPQAVLGEKRRLASHNLWTILHTVDMVREHKSRGTLEKLLVKILEQHAAWFPESRLNAAWERLHE